MLSVCLVYLLGCCVNHLHLDLVFVECENRKCLFFTIMEGYKAGPLRLFVGGNIVSSRRGFSPIFVSHWFGGRLCCVLGCGGGDVVMHISNLQDLLQMFGNMGLMYHFL